MIFFFAFPYGECSLCDLCYTYWEKYFKTITTPLGERLLPEESLLNAHSTRWQEGNSSIQCL